MNLYLYLFWLFFSLIYCNQVRANPLTEEEELATPLIEEERPKEQPEYKMPPRVAPDENVNPVTTSFALNNWAVSHLTEWEVTTGANFGENINFQPIFDSIFKINSQVEESVTSDNILQTTQTGTYFQLRGINTKRKIITTAEIPQTLLGFKLQFTYTDTCNFFDNNSDSDQICTQIPGIVIDEDNIDPETLLPTSVTLTTNVGEVVSPETLEFIKQPGFQRGREGEEIGIDIYIPNSGSVFGNSQGNVTNINRKEELEQTLAGSTSWMRQVVKANDKKAVLGRTIKGWPIIPFGDNVWLNNLVSASNIILPNVEPYIEGSENPVNRAINRNLFLASNNARLPDASLVIYQIGLGEADSITPDVREASQVPSAIYNSLWFGLSPDIEITRDNESFFRFLGPEFLIREGNAEGGSDVNLGNLNISLNAGGQDITPGTSPNFYVQAYTSFLGREVNLVSRSTITEDFDYYPHLSLTGNITSSSSVFRYYGGSIFSNKTRLYVGADYTKNFAKNLDVNVGAIGYLNPNREYYSRAWGSISKRFILDPKQSFLISGRFNYAIDRPIEIANVPEAILPSLASYAILEAQYNWDWLTLSLSNNFDILPDSLPERLSLGATIRFSPYVALSGFWSPIDKNDAKINIGASLNWRLGKDYNSPYITLSWNQYEYVFGENDQGNELNQIDNVFKILLRFGSPNNPF